MGGGAAEERQIGVVPRLEPILDRQCDELASLPIPDELLGEILLRLPTSADLVRASAACVSFRRVANDRRFLRRYRKLHAPPLLGFLDRRKVFHPASAPHPSASAASVVALAADFSFSFLPAPARNWAIQDIRDGRVLLDRPGWQDTNEWQRVVFTEIVVCDPLHRRYLLLPPIPDNLATSVEDPFILKQQRWCEIFLAPPDDDEETTAAEETSFKVIWMAQCQTKLSAFVFSSSTGQWQVVQSQSWSVLLDGLLPWTCMAFFSRRQYAYGCFYWVADDDDLSEKLLMLDICRLEFSMVVRPPRVRVFSTEDIAIVEAGEGITGMFVLARDDLHYIIRRKNGGSSSRQLEKTISLGSVCFYLVGSTGRHLFLNLAGCTSLDAGCFSLDMKTFQLERVFSSELSIPAPCAYSNFPPSLLSTPTISSGVAKGAEKEMLEQGCAASSNALSPW